MSACCLRVRGPSTCIMILCVHHQPISHNSQNLQTQAQKPLALSSAARRRRCAAARRAGSRHCARRRRAGPPASKPEAQTPLHFGAPSLTFADRSAICDALMRETLQEHIDFERRSEKLPRIRHLHQPHPTSIDSHECPRDDCTKHTHTDSRQRNSLRSVPLLALVAPLYRPPTAQAQVNTAP